MNWLFIVQRQEHKIWSGAIEDPHYYDYGYDYDYYNVKE